MQINAQRAKDSLVQSVNSDVESFILYWQQNSALDPLNFPPEMNEDQWMEQFYSWLIGE